MLHFVQTDLICGQPQTSGTVKSDFLPSFLFDLCIKIDGVPMQIFYVDSRMVQSDQPCCVPCWSSSEFWFFKQDDLFVALKIQLRKRINNMILKLLFSTLDLDMSSLRCHLIPALRWKKYVFVDNRKHVMPLFQYLRGLPRNAKMERIRSYVTQMWEIGLPNKRKKKNPCLLSSHICCSKTGSIGNNRHCAFAVCTWALCNSFKLVLLMKIITFANMPPTFFDKW